MVGIKYRICKIMKMSGGATVESAPRKTKFPILLESPLEVESIKVYNSAGRDDTENLSDLTVRIEGNKKIWECKLYNTASGTRTFVLVGYNKRGLPIARTSFTIEITR